MGFVGEVSVSYNRYHYRYPDYIPMGYSTFQFDEVFIWSKTQVCAGFECGICKLKHVFCGCPRILSVIKLGSGHLGHPYFLHSQWLVLNFQDVL